MPTKEAVFATERSQSASGVSHFTHHTRLVTAGQIGSGFWPEPALRRDNECALRSKQ